MTILISETDTFTTDTKTRENTPIYDPNHPGTNNKYNVSYHYNPEVSRFHYGALHPMKPFRLMLTDHLVISYKLYEKMDLYTPRRATKDELLEFHSEDYIDFLQSITPEKLTIIFMETNSHHSISIIKCFLNPITMM